MHISRNLSKKILTVSANYIPPKGGIAQVILTYSTIFDSFNHIVTKRGDKFYQKIFSLLLAIPRFLYICSRHDIKIVHIHASSNNSFYRKRFFINLSHIMGKKIIFHAHGGEFKEFYRKKPDTVKATLKKVDVIIALSESWRIFFQEEVGHPSVKIIENIITEPKVIETTKNKVVRYLFLGQFGTKKGIYDLLKSISISSKMLRGKALFHIGGNGEIKKVNDTINKLGINDLVINEGWVAGEKKNRLLNLADVYILPSYNEGLPISILEAMSYGLPIITTPVGGIPEIIIHNENGLLVQPGDIDALSDAIIKYLDDGSGRKQAGKLSLRKIESHFPSSVSKKLESLYKELLE